MCLKQFLQSTLVFFSLYEKAQFKMIFYAKKYFKVQIVWKLKHLFKEKDKCPHIELSRVVSSPKQICFRFCHENSYTVSLFFKKQCKKLCTLLRFFLLGT